MKVRTFFSDNGLEVARISNLDKQVNDFIDEPTKVESQKLIERFRKINEMTNDPLPIIYEVKIQSVSDCPLKQGTSRVIVYYFEEIKDPK